MGGLVQRKTQVRDAAMQIPRRPTPAASPRVSPVARLAKLRNKGLVVVTTIRCRSGRRGFPISGTNGFHSGGECGRDGSSPPFRRSRFRDRRDHQFPLLSIDDAQAIWEAMESIWLGIGQIGRANGDRFSRRIGHEMAGEAEALLGVQSGCSECRRFH